ncbi:MAG TPA: hypothetical protein VGB28_06490 [Actinomycetota bacterium]|jgi:hypothetical protein
MHRKALLATLLALASVGLLAQPAAANSVSFTDVTLSGNTATVEGAYAFPAIATAQDVGGLNTNFAVHDVAVAAGVDLTAGKIIPINGGLRFVWEISNMPAEVPPEGVRYTWALKIGNTQYQLQAKRTNLASTTTTEDPVGHVQQLAAQKNFFQLRGACQTSYQGTPAAGCYHLAWLNGSFDIAGKKVSMDWPYNTKDQIGRLVAPDFVPGVVLEEVLVASSSITSNFQVVVSNTTTSDYINGWEPYFAGGRVQLGIGNHTSGPEGISYGAPVTLNADGTFDATLSGLSGSANTIFARACNGTTATCAYTSQRVII